MIDPDFTETKSYKQEKGSYKDLLPLIITITFPFLLIPVLLIYEAVEFADRIDNIPPKVVAWLVFGISALIGLLWAKNKIFKG